MINAHIQSGAWNAAKGLIRKIKMFFGLLLKNPQAQYEAGVAFWKIGGEGNQVRSFLNISKAAKKGHPRAQGLLGGMYYHGRSGVVGQNYPKALKWLEKASEQNDLLSQLLLANIYEEGKVVPEDGDKAFKLYLDAGNKGLIKAQIILGRRWEEYQTSSQEEINILVLMSLATDYAFGICTAFNAAKKSDANILEDAIKVYLEALFFILWDIDVMLHLCKQTTEVRGRFFDFALKSISVSYADFDFKQIGDTAIKRFAEYGPWEGRIKSGMGSPSDPIATHLLANLNFALLENDFRKVNYKILPQTSELEYIPFGIQVHLVNTWLRCTVMDLCSNSEDFSEIKSSEFIASYKKAKDNEKKVSEGLG